MTRLSDSRRIRIAFFFFFTGVIGEAIGRKADSGRNNSGKPAQAHKGEGVSQNLSAINITIE